MWVVTSFSCFAGKGVTVTGFAVCFSPMMTNDHLSNTRQVNVYIPLSYVTVYSEQIFCLKQLRFRINIYFTKSMYSTFYIRGETYLNGERHPIGVRVSILYVQESCTQFFYSLYNKTDYR